MLEVPADTPIKSVADLVAFAKKNPSLTYGTAGAGTSMHLSGVLFAQTTQTELTHVAYKGSNPAINDMIGGHIKADVRQSPGLTAAYQSGKARPRRNRRRALASLPDVPTLAEAGLKATPSIRGSAYSAQPTCRRPSCKTESGFRRSTCVARSEREIVARRVHAEEFVSGELDALARAEFERLGKIARDARMTAGVSARLVPWTVSAAQHLHR